ncbi:hypothetical protein ACFQXA_02520 [Nocardiopsis composta]
MSTVAASIIAGTTGTCAAPAGVIGASRPVCQVGLSRLSVTIRLHAVKIFRGDPGDSGERGI